MRDRNCPNCGAVLEIDKVKCPYCGTSYFDLSAIPAREPFFARVKDGERIMLVKAWLESITIEGTVGSPLTVSLEITGYLPNGRDLL